jgi:hypothetical protein
VAAAAAEEAADTVVSAIAEAVKAARADAKVAAGAMAAVSARAMAEGGFSTTANTTAVDAKAANATTLGVTKAPAAGESKATASPAGAADRPTQAMASTAPAAGRIEAQEATKGVQVSSDVVDLHRLDRGSANAAIPGPPQQDQQSDVLYDAVGGPMQQSNPVQPMEPPPQQPYQQQPPYQTQLSYQQQPPYPSQLSYQQQPTQPAQLSYPQAPYPMQPSNPMQQTPPFQPKDASQTPAMVTAEAHAANAAALDRAWMVAQASEKARFDAAADAAAQAQITARAAAKAQADAVAAMAAQTAQHNRAETPEWHQLSPWQPGPQVNARTESPVPGNPGDTAALLNALSAVRTNADAQAAVRAMMNDHNAHTARDVSAIDTFEPYPAASPLPLWGEGPPTAQVMAAAEPTLEEWRSGFHAFAQDSSPVAPTPPPSKAKPIVTEQRVTPAVRTHPDTSNTTALTLKRDVPSAVVANDVYMAAPEEAAEPTTEDEQAEEIEAEPAVVPAKAKADVPERTRQETANLATLESNALALSNTTAATRISNTKESIDRGHSSIHHFKSGPTGSTNSGRTKACVSTVSVASDEWCIATCAQNQCPPHMCKCNYGTVYDKPSKVKREIATTLEARLQQQQISSKTTGSGMVTDAKLSPITEELTDGESTMTFQKEQAPVVDSENGAAMPGDVSPLKEKTLSALAQERTRDDAARVEALDDGDEAWTTPASEWRRPVATETRPVATQTQMVQASTRRTSLATAEEAPEQAKETSQQPVQDVIIRRSANAVDEMKTLSQAADAPDTERDSASPRGDSTQDLGENTASRDTPEREEDASSHTSAETPSSDAMRDAMRKMASLQAEAVDGVEAISTKVGMHVKAMTPVQAWLKARTAAKKIADATAAVRAQVVTATRATATSAAVATAGSSPSDLSSALAAMPKTASEHERRAVEHALQVKASIVAASDGARAAMPMRTQVAGIDRTLTELRSTRPGKTSQMTQQQVTSTATDAKEVNHVEQKLMALQARKTQLRSALDGFKYLTNPSAEDTLRYELATKQLQQVEDSVRTEMGQAPSKISLTALGPQRGVVRAASTATAPVNTPYEEIGRTATKKLTGPEWLRARFAAKQIADAAASARSQVELAQTSGVQAAATALFAARAAAGAEEDPIDPLHARVDTEADALARVQAQLEARAFSKAREDFAAHARVTEESNARAAAKANNEASADVYANQQMNDRAIQAVTRHAPVSRKSRFSEGILAKMAAQGALRQAESKKGSVASVKVIGPSKSAMKKRSALTGSFSESTKLADARAAAKTAAEHKQDALKQNKDGVKQTRLHANISADGISISLSDIRKHVRMGGFQGDTKMPPADGSKQRHGAKAATDAARKPDRKLEAKTQKLTSKVALAAVGKDWSNSTSTATVGSPEATVAPGKKASFSSKAHLTNTSKPKDAAEAVRRAMAVVMAASAAATVAAEKAIADASFGDIGANATLTDMSNVTDATHATADGVLTGVAASNASTFDNQTSLAISGSVELANAETEGMVNTSAANQTGAALVLRNQTDAPAAHFDPGAISDGNATMEADPSKASNQSTTWNEVHPEAIVSGADATASSKVVALVNTPDELANRSTAESQESHPATNATADSTSAGGNLTHPDAKQTAISLLLKPRNRIGAKTMTNTTTKTALMASKAAVTSTKTAAVTRAMAGSKQTNMSLIRTRKTSRPLIKTSSRGTSNVKAQETAPGGTKARRGTTKLVAEQKMASAIKPPRLAPATLHKDAHSSTFVANKQALAPTFKTPLTSMVSRGAKDNAVTATRTGKLFANMPVTTQSKLNVMGGKPAAVSTAMRRAQTTVRGAAKTAPIGARVVAAPAERHARALLTKTAGSPRGGVTARGPAIAKTGAGVQQRAGKTASAMGAKARPATAHTTGGSSVADKKRTQNEMGKIKNRAISMARLSAPNSVPKARAALHVGKDVSSAAKTKLRD